MKKITLLSLFFIIYSLPLLAQDGEPGDPDAGNDPPAPIDNWVIFLIIAGIGVAVYFMLKRKQKSIV